MNIEKIRTLGGKHYESLLKQGYEEKHAKDRVLLCKSFDNYIICFEVFDVSKWESCGLHYEVNTEIEIKNDNFLSITMPKCTLSVEEVESIIKKITNDNPSTV